MLELKEFTDSEHQTWKSLFERQAPLRAHQLVDEFNEGLHYLAMESASVPDLKRINRLLKKKTGFSGVPVTGHEDPRSFFPMLADRKFPIGNFIRDAKDLNYTPAPDVFHDVYGHLPFLADTAYANFCADLGAKASPFINQPDRLRQWERFFWFLLEFALLETPTAGASKTRKIFGAGIASSFGECAYALS